MGKSIIITAFAPFQGRAKNGSSTVLKWLRRNWNPLDAASRILPVEWIRGPSLLRELIGRHRPAIIIGMGEGFPGRIALECRAQNRMNGTDESGAVRMGEPIDSQPAAEQFSIFSRADFTPPTAPISLPIVKSHDAGTFLCNRLLWEILAAKPAAGGFIHLPPQEGTPDHEYRRELGPFVLEVLKAIDRLSR